MSKKYQNINEKLNVKSKRIRIMVILILLCSLFLVFNIFALILEMKNDYYKPTSSYYKINENFAKGNYAGLLNEIKLTDFNEDNLGQPIDGYQAVAYYYEAASYYKLYMDLGNSPKAEKFKDDMEKCKRQIREERFRKAIEEIDQIFAETDLLPKQNAAIQ